MHMSKRITITAGLYFASLNFEKDWPDLPDRHLGSHYLRLDNGGWELSCQFRL